MIPTMKAVSGWFLLLVLSTASSSDQSAESNMNAFYKELGCSPTSPCPESYTCPQTHVNATTCYYKGKAFEDRSTIPQALIGNPCSQACSCRITNGVPTFDCASVDCVEVFDNDLKEQCISTYSLDSCCSEGNVCGKDAIANMKTCEVDGITYKEGQRFTPKNSFKNCICTDKWNGNITSEYCKDINCGIEIHYQDKLFKGCAPMYVGEKQGCPIGFQCPSADMKLIAGINIKGVKDKCTFGNLTLAVGDDVGFDNKCKRCTCFIPPMVTCVKFNSSECLNEPTSSCALIEKKK